MFRSQLLIYWKKGPKFCVPPKLSTKLLETVKLSLKVFSYKVN